MTDFIIEDGILVKCRSNISSAIIPNEVKEIHGNAFMGITKLKKIELPEGLIKIGKRAFGNCYALEEVNIPKTVKTIENGAFNDCVALSIEAQKNIHSINPLAVNLKLNKVSKVNKVKPTTEGLNWRNIIDNSLNEYVYCIDPATYKLLYINDTLLNTLGKVNYMNKRCYELFFDNDEPCILCKKDQLKFNESLAWYDNYNNNEDCYLVRSLLTNVNNEITYIQTSHKVTEHLDKFNILEKMAIADKTIIQCAKTIANKSDIEESIDSLLELICKFKDSKCVFLFELNYDTNKTNLAHLYKGENPDLKQDVFEYNDFDINSFWLKELANNEYIYLNKNTINDELIEHYNPFVLVNELNNFLIVPIKVNNVIVAVIGTNNMKDTSDRLKHFSTLRTVSSFIMYALSVKYSKQKLQETVTKLKNEVDINEVLFKCSQILLNSNDFDMSMNELLSILRNFFDCSRIYIFRINENNNTVYDWFEQLHLVKSNIGELCNICNEEIDICFKNYNEDGLVFITDINLIKKEESLYKILLLDEVDKFAFTTINKEDSIFGYLWIDNPNLNISELNLLKTISLFITNHIVKSTLVSELESLSYTDKLTNLYNRNFFNDYVSKMKDVENLGVMFADVNSLKLANDNLGHEYGDLLIRCCAKVLSESINGFCFRLGGDEFIIFCEHITQEEFEENLSILDNMMIDCGDVHISIGSSWCSLTEDVSNEIKKADDDMYIKKALYYEEKSKDKRTPDKQLSDLRSSIDNLKVLFNL